MKKTKIIATLGPKSFDIDIISSLIKEGMDVARINMSHYNNDFDLKSKIKIIRDESIRQQRSVAILFDLCGPKIRIDKLDNDFININEGSEYTLGNSKSSIPLNINLSFGSDSIGGIIKMDDGKLTFNVIEVQNGELIIRANESGKIYSGKGVNFPGVPLDLPSLTNKDKLDLDIAVSLKADWIAMSFVRSANDYDVIKKELQSRGVDIPIIAKIEKPEAINNLGEIINSFNGILVARGDLGVEMPIKKLPILQKKIVNECLQKRKPVIIATQMLETMINSSVPTRAEVNDIANAIYDGADAMMLSGETAIGDYPVESIKIMDEIASSIDKDLDFQNFNRYIRQKRDDSTDVRGAICHSAMILSNDLQIKNIVIMTESGITAMKMARYRPSARIFALCTNEEVYYMLSLIWGIIPILVNPYSTTEKMIYETGDLLLNFKYVKKGDSFIITAGVSAGVSGSTNMLKIHTV